MSTSWSSLKLRSVESRAPTDDELHALLQTVIARLMKMLTRRGVLIKEMGQTYLADPDADSEEARALRPPLAAATTDRIALGPRAGQKMLTHRGAMPRRASRVKLHALIRQRRKIFSCARNVRHWLELVERGFESVERETFESALRTGRQALEALGIEPYEAREVADLFRRHNLAALQALRPHFHDEEKTVALDRSGQIELEQNLRRDREMREARRKAEGWH